LTGIIIDDDSLNIVIKVTINYDRDLPYYKTQNGVYISEDGKQVYSNPLMWIKALDNLISILQKIKFPLNDIKVISGSAQQHGTIYLNKNFLESLTNLQSDNLLASQLKRIFSRELSPVWMDSSTSKQCQEIREALGGLKSTIKLTGSNTYERFSGPQIRKFFQENPEEYKKTAHIHLISSFLSSLLLGTNSPIDHGDGAGMNLMDIKNRCWDETAIDATAPNLKQRLPNLTESFKVLGNISSYFVERYNFSSETKLLPWSGDNPSSLIGVGLIHPYQAAISLGTSDTYFRYMEKLSLDFSGASHVFGAPTGDYMGLICFKNGSLAREAIKTQFNLTWNEFSNVLKQSSPGNKGGIMLPYFYPEIVPLVLEPKVYRFGFNANDLQANVRGIIEAQCLSIYLHSQWLKPAPTELIATGGGSENQEILQVLSDVFNIPIKVLKISDSAALGATLRCAKAYQEDIKNEVEWSDLIAKCDALQPELNIFPSVDTKQLYDDMKQIYQLYENFVLYNGDNPEIIRKKFKEKYFE
jgi:xylulokinase